MFVLPLAAQQALVHEVKGIILSAVDKQPVQGVQVYLHETKIGTLTDSTGRFSIPNVKKGSYHLHITILGFEPVDYTLRVDENMQEVRLLLEPTFIEIGRVTIESDMLKSGNKEQSLNVTIADGEYLLRNYGGSLPQTLEKIPGVTLISMGTGIAKPVIRGLSLNRVIVNDHGIKMEGQQWGFDHGLEIDQYDVERIELIKGATSLLYGSEGIGGIINILPPHIPKEGSLKTDVLTLYRSNNHLFANSIGVSGNHKKTFFRLRVTTQDFGDYRMPADEFTYNGFVLPLVNNRLKNTAGSERNVTGSVGIVRNWGNLRLTVSNFHQRAGMFAGAIGTPRSYQLTDDGNPRDIQLPLQRNNHFKAVINSKIMIKDSWLQTDFGYQNNYRREESDPHFHGKGPTPKGKLALGLRLDTWTLNSTFHKYLTERVKMVTGISTQYRHNQRDGFEFLLPAYRAANAGAMIYFEYNLNEHTTLSGGARFDYGWQHIERYVEPVYINNETIDGYSQRVPETTRSFYNPSGALGVSYSPTRSWNLKMNLARSFRVPSPAELGQNGVHHGTFRHEQGDSSLRSETGIQLDAGMYYTQKKVRLEFTPYFYYFDNYIYLRPTGSFSPFVDAGQIYRYTEAPAIVAGSELLLEYHPLEKLHLETAFEYVYNFNVETNLPLPFTPPLSISVAGDYDFGKLGKRIESLYVGTGYKYYAPQNQVDRNESATPGYGLMYINTGISFRFKQQELEVQFRVDNLLDEQYLNHMSRYRILNLPEPGRNFMITVKAPLTILKGKED